MNQKLKPLIVDLDGTLIQTDVFLESSIIYMRGHILGLFYWILWLVKSGRPGLKAELVQRVEIDVETLPYNLAVLELIKSAREQGREVVLATASHKQYAEQVAAHLGLFDKVLATEGNINLSARKKRDKLVSLYGEKGFDYAGNAYADIPVWEMSNQSIVVDPHPGVLNAAKRIGNVGQVIERKERGSLKAWIKALRLHQWIKNFLILVPLLASHEFTAMNVWVIAPLAFLFFGLCSSSVYMLNDILDIQDDRKHPTKCKRAFASGQLSIESGLLVFPLLLLAAFIGSYFLLRWEFVLVLACYYALTLLYSFSFKRVVVLDVIVLGALYTLRIIAGSFAFDVKLTFWMLAFSMFIFLSLALVKRYSELLEVKQQGKKDKAHGRGYFTSDLEMIAALGAAAGYLSVMVLALYTQDAATVKLYSRPEIIWFSCPVLLFWISRIWVIAHRGLMHEDPVVFAIKDRVSVLAGVIFIIIFGCAV